MDERDDDEGSSSRPVRLEENDETVRYLLSLEQQLSNRSIDPDELVGTLLLPPLPTPH